MQLPYLRELQQAQRALPRGHVPTPAEAVCSRTLPVAKAAQPKGYVVPPAVVRKHQIECYEA